MVQSLPDNSSHRDDKPSSEPPPTMMEVDVSGTPTDEGSQRLEDTLVDGATAALPDSVRTPDEIPAGTRLGKYEIQRRLGVGGMGEVYLAFDPMLQREVALKVLLPDVAARPELFERFLREARAIGQLSHPHVVAVHDIGEHADRQYIVMELLSGGSVHDLIRNEQAVPWKKACQLIADAAEGLQAAHDAGLIHRDIKPENLMLTSDHIVKIVDFGLAKSLATGTDAAQSTVSRVGQVMGTPQFMSPEQFSGQTVDHRCDIYGLGGTLYQLLTRQFPFGDAQSVVELMYSHLEQPAPDPRQLRSDIPEQCTRIIARAMAKKPEDRFQCGRELADELKAVIQDSPVTAQPLVDTALRNVCIVEPSRMQAHVLKKNLAAQGIPNVQVFASAEEFLNCEFSNTQLLITSMQLPGMTGAELMHALTAAGSPAMAGISREATLILRSDDVELQSLHAGDTQQPVGIIPRSSAPARTLRSVAAMSNLRWDTPSDGPPPDLMMIRLLIRCDDTELPTAMAELIRTSGLLDVQVRTSQNLTQLISEQDSYDLMFDLSTKAGPFNSSTKVAKVIGASRATPADSGLRAYVELQEARLVLRGLSGPDLQAVTCCELGVSRMHRLLQSCIAH